MQSIITSMSLILLFYIAVHVIFNSLNVIKIAHASVHECDKNISKHCIRASKSTKSKSKVPNCPAPTYQDVM